MNESEVTQQTETGTAPVAPATRSNNRLTKKKTRQLKKALKAYFKEQGPAYNDEAAAVYLTTQLGWGVTWYNVAGMRRRLGMKKKFRLHANGARISTPGRPVKRTKVKPNREARRRAKMTDVNLSSAIGHLEKCIVQLGKFLSKG